MSLPTALLCAACMIATPAVHETTRNSIAMVSEGASLVRAVQIQVPNLLRLDDAAAKKGMPLNPQARETALATALALAWKRDFIEDGVAQTRNTLVACQRETSLLMIMPFMRSDGQQAHCFRF